MYRYTVIGNQRLMIVFGIRDTKKSNSPKGKSDFSISLLVTIELL